MDGMVEDIEIDTPGTVEVLVRVAAPQGWGPRPRTHHVRGRHITRADDRRPRGPPGYVEDAGLAVTLVRRGDYFVFASIPPNAGACPSWR